MLYIFYFVLFTRAQQYAVPDSDAVISKRGRGASLVPALPDLLEIYNSPKIWYRSLQISTGDAREKVQPFNFYVITENARQYLLILSIQIKISILSALTISQGPCCTRYKIWVLRFQNAFVVLVWYRHYHICCQMRKSIKTKNTISL